MTTQQKLPTKPSKKDNIKLLHQQQQQTKHHELQYTYQSKQWVSENRNNKENIKNRKKAYTNKDDIFWRARKKSKTTLQPIPENFTYGHQHKRKFSQTTYHNLKNQIIKLETKKSQSKPPDNMMRSSTER